MGKQQTQLPRRGNRVARPEVEEISTSRHVIGLSKGQFFCSTACAWEVWQKKPLRRIVRIPADRVTWVGPQPGLQTQRHDEEEEAGHARKRAK